MSRKSDELKQAYLRWLEPQLKDGLSPNTKSYWELLLYMFEKPFGWLDNVPMDENRAVDGTDLRVEFEDGTGGFFPLAWPQEDQRAVELWYQLNSFVEELHPEH
jgi:hypothetical protein